MCALLNAFGERKGWLWKKSWMKVLWERECVWEWERERENTLIFVFPSLAGITQHGIVIILSPSVDCVTKVLPVYNRRKSMDFPF